MLYQGKKLREINTLWLPNELLFICGERFPVIGLKKGLEFWCKLLEVFFRVNKGMCWSLFCNYFISLYKKLMWVAHYKCCIRWIFSSSCATMGFVLKKLFENVLPIRRYFRKCHVGMAQNSTMKKQVIDCYRWYCFLLSLCHELAFRPIILAPHPFRNS